MWVFKRHIENQEQQRLNQSFRDESVELLRKHCIEFDKRYSLGDKHFG